LDTKHVGRGSRIDSDDVSMGVGRAHEHGIGLVRHIEIIDVTPPASQ
jgi:hypothetical protein